MRMAELAEQSGCSVATIKYYQDRKSTRLNSSHEWSSYAVCCLKKKKTRPKRQRSISRPGGVATPTRQRSGLTAQGTSRRFGGPATPYSMQVRPTVTQHRGTEQT